jgi:hypothetical protein
MQARPVLPLRIGMIVGFLDPSRAVLNDGLQQGRGAPDAQNAISPDSARFRIICNGAAVNPKFSVIAPENERHRSRKPPKPAPQTVL